jgi:chemotaxis methyl-accepting protein methylase
MAKLKGMVHIQIYATDLDKDSIDRARQGVYPANIARTSLLKGCSASL